MNPFILSQQFFSVTIPAVLLWPIRIKKDLWAVGVTYMRSAQRCYSRAAPMRVRPLQRERYVTILSTADVFK